MSRPRQVSPRTRTPSPPSSSSRARPSRTRYVSSSRRAARVRAGLRARRRAAEDHSARLRVGGRGARSGRVAVAVVACFLHAGAASNEKALVAAALDESGTDAGMAFQGVANAAEETRRRDARLDRRAASLVPVTSEEASRAFREWIDGVARDVADAASRGGLLRGVCSLAASAETERRVVDRIARDDDAEPAETTRASRCWGNLWTRGRLAEAPRRSRARIDARGAAPGAFRDATDAALAAANSKHRETRGRGAATRGAPCRDTKTRRRPRERRRRWRTRGRRRRRRASRRATPRSRRERATRRASRRRRRRRRRRATDRLARLEPFAHAECHAGVMSYASFLAERLAAVESVATTASFSATATERALLLAMTAHAAASRHEQLAALMGPSSEWSAVDENFTASRGARVRLRRVAGRRGLSPGARATQRQIGRGARRAARRRRRGFRDGRKRTRARGRRARGGARVGRDAGVRGDASRLGGGAGRGRRGRRRVGRDDSSPALPAPRARGDPRRVAGGASMRRVRPSTSRAARARRGDGATVRGGGAAFSTPRCFARASPRRARYGYSSTFGSRRTLAGRGAGRRGARARRAWKARRRGRWTRRRRLRRSSSASRGPSRTS